MRRRQQQQRSGFGFWGPLPSYTRRTKRGGSVRVTGCCLPLTLAMTAAPVVAGRALLRRTG